VRWRVRKNGPGAGFGLTLAEQTARPFRHYHRAQHAGGRQHLRTAYPLGDHCLMSRILIVEDEPAILRGLADNLHFESYEVMAATDDEKLGRVGLGQHRAEIGQVLHVPGIFHSRTACLIPLRTSRCRRSGRCCREVRPMFHEMRRSGIHMIWTFQEYKT